MPFKPFVIQISPIAIWVLTLINLCVIGAVFYFISSTNKAPSPVFAPLKTMNSSFDSTTNDMVADNAFDIEALNAYGQAIARAGLQHCAQPMNDLSTRLLAGKQVGLYRFPVTSENFTSLSVEVSADGGATIYMTFNLSQTPDGACHIAYEAVSDWENKCEDVVKTIFKDFVPTRNLMKTVALLSHPTNPNRKIFTMPVNKGCIAIEKEVVFTDNAL